MRIRRRPNSTSSPTFPSLLAPDPSNLVQSLGATRARGEENSNHLQERLHQDVDLSKNAQLLTDPSNPTFVQVKNEGKNMEENKEEEEEEMVAVGSKFRWDHGQVHSNNNNKR